MIEKKVNSVYAAYAVPAAMLLYGIFFPLYKLTHLIFASVVCAAAWFLAGKILPKKVILVEKPALLSLTGEARVDEAIKTANECISEIRKANAAIPDKTISQRIDEIEALTKKIFDFIIEHPDELTSARRFINYYLPTTQKLLNTYSELEKQGIDERNISQTKNKIADMLNTIIDAFKKQLDSLFAYTALDISAEISAMQGILASEGLSGADDINESLNSEISSPQLKL